MESLIVKITVMCFINYHNRIGFPNFIEACEIKILTPNVDVMWTLYWNRCYLPAVKKIDYHDPSAWQWIYQGLVIFVSQMGHHRFRYWLIVFASPINHLNQLWPLAANFSNISITIHTILSEAMHENIIGTAAKFHLPLIVWIQYSDVT